MKLTQIAEKDWKTYFSCTLFSRKPRNAIEITHDGVSSYVCSSFLPDSYPKNSCPKLSLQKTFLDGKEYYVCSCGANPNSSAQPKRVRRHSYGIGLTA